VAIFALLFVVLPLVEIAVAVQVSHVIGALNTIVILILLSLSGVWLTKFAGFGVVARIRTQLEAGRMPTNELIDGALVLTGGVLLIVPGFVTAVLGLLLMFPATRAIARTAMKHRFRGRVTYLGGSVDNGRLDGPDIIDI
jgi:UPF0716 protein FxsA